MSEIEQIGRHDASMWPNEDSIGRLSLPRWGFEVYEQAAGPTGWPPSRLMQDDCRPLSRWLANTPNARQDAREAAQEIETARKAETNQPKGLPLWEMT